MYQDIVKIDKAQGTAEAFAYEELKDELVRLEQDFQWISGDTEVWFDGDITYVRIG